MKKWILKRLGIDDWDLWIEKRLDTKFVKKLIESGRKTINQLVKFSVKIGKYIEITWDKVDGNKRLLGLAVFGLGVFLDSEQIMEFGGEIIGVGFLHKLYKMWQEDKNKQ